MKVRYRNEFDPRERRTLPSPTRGLPFAKSSRGVLVHRVRSVTIYAIHASPHAALQYWCSMVGTHSFDGVNRHADIQMMEEPEEGQLICHRCEAIAVLSGEQTSDQLVGRHVHKGRVRPQRTCCTSEP